MSFKIVNGIMSDEEIESQKIAREEKRFFSNLGAFNTTNGIRPRELSVIVGKQGQGKSTLCRTIAMECAISGKKVYTLLSEEDAGVYKGKTFDVFNKMTNFKAEKFLSNMLYESMLEWKKENLKPQGFLSRLEYVVNEYLPEMIIFDNFTTSFIGSLNISLQGEIITDLRKMARIYDIAMVAIFHTAKGTDIYKKLLDGEDVRGNATATNAGSYNYILTTFGRGKEKASILNVDKARYHKETHKSYWKLEFDHEKEIFTKDERIEYSKVLEIQKELDGIKVKKIEKIKKEKTWYEPQL